MTKPICLLPQSDHAKRLAGVIKAVEYYRDGVKKRIEFHPPTDDVVREVMAMLDERLKPPLDS